MTTADPSNPTSLNRYAYVNGDPVNYGDRSGRILVAAGGGLVLDCGDGASSIYDGTCTGTDGGWGGGDGGGGGNACSSYENLFLGAPGPPGCDAGGEGGSEGGEQDSVPNCGQSIDWQSYEGTDVAVMAITSFFEYQSTGTKTALSVWAAIDWTFENLYNLSPKAAAMFYGSANKVPSTLQGVIETASQVWAGGQLKYAANLSAILNGPEGSGLCDGLLEALETATDVIGGATANPVPGALEFASGGAKPRNARGVTLTTVGTYESFTFYQPVYLAPPKPKRKRQ
jgi:hypothetical protein